MLKFLFIFIVALHGLIHLMGFAKAFRFAEMNQLTQAISKAQGIFWLAATLLFLVTASLFLLKKEWWLIVASAAVVISQSLIMTSWQDAKFGSLANLIILLVALAGFASWRFASAYERDVKAELANTANFPTTLLTENDIANLPEPVKKYLRYNGAIGKPKVHSFKITFNGKIRKDRQSAWMPFTSEQYNFLETSARLFFMKAVMKGLPVAGYHRFINGKASMDIRLLSAAQVQYQAGNEMDVAETVTFFNDMACMVPATLIDSRIKWLEVENNKVKAAFTSNQVMITAWLFFDEEGKLVNFVSDDRFAVDAGQKLRWSTPLKAYHELNGHRVPSSAEAIYSYPTGDLSYGTFSVQQIEYNCTQ